MEITGFMGYSNILLIDDDEEDQEIFLSALGEISDTTQCDAYSDASLALDKLKSKQLAPDVIFLDLNMPIMNGQQFLKEIKKNEQLKDIPVIIFSTSSHEGTIALTRELGAHAFITKPSDFNSLIYTLKPLIV